LWPLMSKFFGLKLTNIKPYSGLELWPLLIKS